MKKIINGRRYDTNTAKALADASANCPRNDFNFWEETLYRKNTGEYFIHGTGGPMTQYAESCGNNSWCGGEKIIPLTIEAAKKWAEKHLDGDEYEKIFGAIEEDTSKRTVTFSLTETAIAKIARLAAEQNCSKSEIIERLLG